MTPPSQSLLPSSKKLSSPPLSNIISAGRTTTEKHGSNYSIKQRARERLKQAELKSEQADKIKALALRQSAGALITEEGTDETLLSCKLSGYTSGCESLIVRW